MQQRHLPLAVVKVVAAAAAVVGGAVVDAMVVSFAGVVDSVVSEKKTMGKH